MPDASFEVEGEMDLGGLKVRGRADLLLPDRVVDIKYARSTSRGLPHPHHVAQVRLYMRMFGRPKGSLLYVSPDRVAEVDESVEPSLAQPMSDEEIKQLLNRALGGAGPAYPEWECDYCTWSGACPRAVRGGAR